MLEVRDQLLDQFASSLLAHGRARLVVDRISLASQTKRLTTDRRSRLLCELGRISRGARHGPVSAPCPETP